MTDNEKPFFEQKAEVDAIVDEANTLSVEDEDFVAKFQQGLDELTGDEESELIKHARLELDLVNEHPDLIEMTIDAIKAFENLANYTEAPDITAAILHQLMIGANLRPLSDNPEEWQDFGEINPRGGHVWKNRRNHNAISTDGGKTYTLMFERDPETLKQGPVHTSIPSEDVRLVMPSAPDVSPSDLS